MFAESAGAWLLGAKSIRSCRSPSSLSHPQGCCIGVQVCSCNCMAWAGCSACLHAAPLSDNPTLLTNESLAPIAPPSSLPPREAPSACLCLLGCRCCKRATARGGCRSAWSQMWTLRLTPRCYTLMTGGIQSTGGALGLQPSAGVGPYGGPFGAAH